MLFSHGTESDFLFFLLLFFNAIRVFVTAWGDAAGDRSLKWTRWKPGGGCSLLFVGSCPTVETTPTHPTHKGVRPQVSEPSPALAVLAMIGRELPRSPQRISSRSLSLPANVLGARIPHSPLPSANRAKSGRSRTSRRTKSSQTGTLSRYRSRSRRTPAKRVWPI
jgi:hypothetical protein